MTENRRAILWVVFIGSLVFLWQSYAASTGRDIFGAPLVQATSATPSAASSGNASSTAGVPDGSIPAATASAAPSAAGITPAGTPSATPAKGEVVHIKTDLIAVDINSVGAEIDRLELLQHKDQDHTEQNMVLLQKTGDITYVAQTGLAGAPDLPTHNTPFTLTPGPTSLADGQNKFDVVFTAESGGVKLVKTYTFTRDSYVIGVTHQVTNLGHQTITPNLYLQLVRDSSKPAGTMRFYSPYYGPAIFDATDHFRKISFDDVKKKEANDPQANVHDANDGWVAMLQHYFVAAWIPPEGVARKYLTQPIKDSPNYRAAALMSLGQIAPEQTVTNTSRLFVGPEEERLLEEVSPGLELTRDYGWSGRIAEPVFWCLEHLHSLIGNWGWAIIVLTLCIKLAFFPLSAASYRSMARMKGVAPRLKLLQEKYKDDRVKLNQAMMELYKAEKINPAGGCLPILIQIPVFIALYATLSASVEMRGAPWLGWIHDLGAPDPFYILPIIMMASMFVQYKLNPAPTDPAQAKVMMIMPLVFGVTFFFFPAGLVLYWVTNNLSSIAQQYWITRVMSTPASKTT